MKRYEPEVRDGTLVLVADDDELEVGGLDRIVDAVGGGTYTITYTDEQRAQPWLDTDDEGRLEIDVRDTVTSMTHRAEFVDRLRAFDMSTDRYGLPERTVEFANEFVDILEEQGGESQ
jgi:hypothetical protein